MAGNELDGLEVVTLADARRIARWAFQADAPLHWIGEPGIGKSACAQGLADDLGLPLVTLILSQRAPEDVGGVPVPGAGGAGSACVPVLPIGTISRVVDAPGLLFLDEIGQAPPHLQGPALSLVNERLAGDVRLHPDTRILLASNPISSGTSGQELSAPLVNRIHSVVIRPDVAEVSAYLSQIGADGSTLRALGADYSATLDRSPNLLQLDAPAGGGVGAPWASPRAIVRALKIWASAIDSGERADDLQVAKWSLAGSIGAGPAGAYLAILRVRDRIASPAEILKDPRKCKAPTDVDTGIASLGVVARVAEVDVGAAWIYVSRLSPEFRQALMPKLQAKAIDPRSPWAKEGSAEKIRALGAYGATIARNSASAPRGGK